MRPNSESHDNDGVVEILTKSLGQGGDAIAQQPQMSGKLTRSAALVNVSVPAAEAGKSEPDPSILYKQVG